MKKFQQKRDELAATGVSSASSSAIAPAARPRPTRSQWTKDLAQVTAKAKDLAPAMAKAKAKARAKAKAKSSCQSTYVKSCWCSKSIVWNALYKCDRFMIRLPAKFDLAAPEASSQVWLRGERRTTSGLEVCTYGFSNDRGWTLRPSITYGYNDEGAA